MSLDFVEKDAVLFALPNDLASTFGKELGLGGVINTNGPSQVQLQLLCIRESGSMEFYADSRVPPFTVPASDIIKVMHRWYSASSKRADVKEAVTAHAY